MAAVPSDILDHLAPDRMLSAAEVEAAAERNGTSDKTVLTDDGPSTSTCRGTATAPFSRS